MASVRSSEDSMRGSRIFNSLRTIGQVSSDVPCLLRYIHRRRENFIITCVGKSFHTFASQKLQLLTTSGAMPDDISCMAVDTYHVYTAARNEIYAWRRGFEVKHIYRHEADVLYLLTYPPNLISFHADGQLVVWDVVAESSRTVARLDSNTFTPCVIMHPATYVNKILIGSEQGGMILLNIRTARYIHHFNSFNSKILRIVQTPAVDVVAIALADKRVILHNIRSDDTLMKFNCIEEPMSLAFRLDGPPILITASPQGSITLWDLETQELVSHIEKAHEGPVNGLECFPQEPIFVSSSSDNSIRVWIFDMPDGSFRLLNSRAGHAKPSNQVRFFGKEAEAKYVLSASMDGSFRMFHIYNETYNRCLSRAKISRKEMKMNGSYGNLSMSKGMPPITHFTTQTVTAPSHHADIAACHSGQVGLSTWSFVNTKRGEKTLMLPKYEKLPKVNVVATCITMTACCQFVIAGYDNGTVARFNIQSGLHRRTYAPKEGLPAHVDSGGTGASVRGVAVDELNIAVLTGGSSGNLKFWDFKSGTPLEEVPIPAGVNFIFHRATDYFAGVALDDFSIYVINLGSRTTFRKITEISSPVTDASFSPDNMWLTAATSDCLVRTWDLTTANMIDVVRLDSIVISIDYSPTGEHVVGSFCDKTGIFVWSNKTLYDHVSLMPLPLDYEPPFLPVSTAAHTTEEFKDEEMTLEYESPMQIEKNLITLSLLPESRWKNLLNLETIKLRNRPKQPPKTYVAPFFLPSMISLGNEEVSGVENGVGIPDSNQELEVTKDAVSKILNPEPEILLSPFARRLVEIEVFNEIEASELCNILGEMGPSKIDLEIRALGPNGGGSVNLLKQFLRFATSVCMSKQNFENGQAYLALFLKIHGEGIYETEELMPELESLQEWLPADHVQNKVNKVISYLTFLKSRLQ